MPKRQTRTAVPAMIEAFEDRVLFSTYTVTTVSDSGSGSLRDAINQANKSSGSDVIQFKISSGAKTISPSSALPQITGVTTLDATTQPGYSGKPLIEIRGDKAGGGSNGIVLTGGSSTVKGLVINRFGANGILVVSKGGNTIKNCYIGTDAAGSVAAANKQKGIVIQSSGNTIGGTASTDKVVISGNTGNGIQFYTTAASGNKLLGSYIGTDATGTKAIPNGTSGVAVYGGASNTIGGTASGSRNVISGNKQDGIVINNSGAKYNTVLGNYIGLNASGNAKIGNGNYGVEISQPNNTVGGAASGSRNVISGNGYTGVVLWLASGSSCKVQGNYIGTDATGMIDLGNKWRGIDISNGSGSNVIGGASSAERNVISGNDEEGILVYQGSNNLIQNNYVGLGADGVRAIPNAEHGISLIQTSSATLTGNKIGNNGGNGINSWNSASVKASGNTLVNDTLYGLKSA